jgi:chromosome segregation ATPase
MFREIPDKKDLNRSHLDESAVKRMEYKDRERERQEKETKLRERQNVISELERKLEFQKRSAKEMIYVLRRIEAEESRTKVKYDQEIKEDENVEKNLHKEQEELKKSNMEIDSKSSELKDKIDELNQEIYERKRELEKLISNEADTQREKERSSRRRQGVVSRLIQFFEKEKRETQIILNLSMRS